MSAHFISTSNFQFEDSDSGSWDLGFLIWEIKKLYKILFKTFFFNLRFYDLMKLYLVALAGHLWSSPCLHSFHPALIFDSAEPKLSPQDLSQHKARVATYDETSFPPKGYNIYLVENETNTFE